MCLSSLSLEDVTTLALEKSSVRFSLPCRWKIGETLILKKSVSGSP